jgi:hypothetical protein
MLQINAGHVVAGREIIGVDETKLIDLPKNSKRNDC